MSKFLDLCLIVSQLQIRSSSYIQLVLVSVSRRHDEAERGRNDSTE